MVPLVYPLARQHRSGDLVAVWVSGEEQEAIRNLVGNTAHGRAVAIGGAVDP